MATNAQSNPTKTAILIGLGAFILTVIFVLWKYGAQGLFAVVKKLALWSLILFAIFLVVFLVVWLFQKKKIDMVHVHKERVRDACKLNEAPYKQTLMFKAYGDDFGTRRVGSVIGVSQIYAEPPKRIVKKVNGDGDEEIEYKPATEKYRRLIFVAFTPPGLFNRLFGNFEIAAGIREDFYSLSADVIYLNGMTFAPPLYEIFFLSHHWENRALIDETIKGNIFRMTFQEGLKEMAEITEESIDLSPKHVKQKEVSNMQQMPNQQGNNGGQQ